MAERRLHSTAFNALFTRKKPKHGSKYWCKRCIDGPSYKKGHAATCPLASKQGDSTETDKQRYYNQAFKFLLSHRGRMSDIEGEPWYQDLLQLARRAKHVVGVGPLCKHCYSRTSKKTKDHRDRADPNAGEGYYVCLKCPHGKSWAGWARDVDLNVDDLLAISEAPAVPDVVDLTASPASPASEPEASVIDLTK